MIKGIPVTLIIKHQSGVDPFNRPIYTDDSVVVDNVIVAPLSGPEVVDVLELTGRKASYQLGIPKGDTHTWENAEVEFFGERWRVIGKPTQGIDELIPLDWNKKVMVESKDGAVLR